MARAGIASRIDPAEACRPRVWREWEWLVLVCLVVAIYFPRLTAMTIRGEESRRATVAMEMIASGDWIVPRQQGEAIFMSSRPPLQSWTIAAIGLARGRVDAVSVRLPSVIALVLLVVLIYAYSRTFLSRFGAFAAAAAYATMAQVLELGRLGETDALFALFLGGSLLVWHWGYVRRWPAVCTWAAAYLLVALATLTKGPQAPVYFAASVGTYLLITRQWRFALSWPHLAGILVFAAVLGSWQVPFYLMMGTEGVRHVFGGDVAIYLHDWRWDSILEHLLNYPINILLGTLLPWSVFLLAYLGREFRRSLGPARRHVWFLAGAIAVTFPTVWLIPDARTRFFMPLYPCFAVLIGLAVERCCQSGAARDRGLWKIYMALVAIVMVGAGVVIFTGTLVRGAMEEIAQPLPFAVFYLVATMVLAAVAFWSRGAATRRHCIAGVISVVAFLGLTSSGALVNIKIATSEHTAEAIAAMKEKMPAGARLVSFEPVDHLFAYHYGKSIERRPMEWYTRHLDDEGIYFCVGENDELPFTWEKVAVICCDRYHTDAPERQVIVGRRVPPRSPERAPIYQAELPSGPLRR
jgi:4-amino-4-deoxy-L-arabinose transferase-like glycosyltransferase